MRFIHIDENGNEIEPMKVEDLIEQLQELAKRHPDSDVMLMYTGRDKDDNHRNELAQLFSVFLNCRREICLAAMPREVIDTLQAERIERNKDKGMFDFD